MATWIAAPGVAAPALRAISVLPGAITLDGPRAQQGLIVTGTYADGSARDLTGEARLEIGNANLARLETDGVRPIVRPLADGRTKVVVTVGDAPPAWVWATIRRQNEPAPVSFLHEVVPSLTRLGCNQGTCHGTTSGKGGLRLSLQGYDPLADYQRIAREGGGRRIVPGDAAASLLLKKPTLTVAHGGGQRLTQEMPELELLARWIAEGARLDADDAPHLTRLEMLPRERALKLPDARQRVTAMAHFSDGSVRDVTTLAKLSSSDDEIATVSADGLATGVARGDAAVMVRYEDRLETVKLTLLRDVEGFRWPNPPAASYVDEHVFARLRLFQLPPSGLSSDSEFVRRAYLDTIGLPPQPEEARAFLADRSPDKRARLIDALLQRPEFADFWALKWADLLRIKERTLRNQGARAYHQWVRDSIAARKPMDQLARELLTASGAPYDVAPANYYVATTGPSELAETTAQVFLGVRMACARCHNHPFDQWTQDEYYAFAAFFSQVQVSGGSRRRPPNVSLKMDEEITHQRTGEVMQPKLLGGPRPEIAADADRRLALAAWITAGENPFFARTMVNRIWANLLGAGIVNPIDDFRSSNPPLNEPLLDALAADFVTSGFDLRHLVRRIMNSRTYQLSSRTEALNADDHRYFSHAMTRLLTAEQLADAISQLAGVPDRFEGYDAGTRAAQLAGLEGGTMFLEVFGRPDRNLACECERETEPTLFQALALISDKSTQGKLESAEGRLGRLLAAGASDADVLEELYLAAFARPPTERDRSAWAEHLAAAGDRRQALEDLVWALINSREFLFRH